MRVLVTGGAGFVGSHLVEQLLARGESVRVLVRCTSNRENLGTLPVEWVTGDLRDAATLAGAVQGCQRVFHCAADYRLWTPRPADLYETNVQGTDELLRACRQAGVERVVYTSSVATIGNPSDGSPGDEETPVRLEDMVGHYKRSKFQAQEVALRQAAEGLPVVVVNPSTPIGPRDRRPTATGRIVTDYLTGRMPAYVDTGLNLVAVEDAAAGHLLAADRGAPGRIYILGGQNLTLKEILDLLGEITGRPSPRVRLPHALVYAMACADTWVEGRLLGREPRIPLEGVRMSRKRMWFRSDRAVRELGYHPGSVVEALRRAVRWFVDQGYALR